MPNRGALESILADINEALAPLVDAVQTPPPGSGVIAMALEMGVDLSTVLDPGTAATFAAAISNSYNTLLGLVQDPSGFAGKISEVLQAIRDFKTVVQTLNALAKDTEFDLKLFNYLLYKFVEREAPALQAVLTLGGVFVSQPVAAAGNVPAYVTREIHWEQFPKLLSPSDVLKDLYGWGTANLDSNLLLSRIEAILWSLGIPSAYRGGGSPGTDGIINLLWGLAFDGVMMPLGVQVGYLPASSQPPGLSVVPTGMASFSTTIAAPAGWQLSVELDAAASAGFGLSIRPSSGLTLGPLPGQPAVTWTLTGKFGFARSVATGESRIVIIGSPDGARLEATTVGFKASIQAGSDKGDAGIEFDIVGGKLVIATSDADSFLQKLLPAGGLSLDFDFGLGWSKSRDLYFVGNAGLEASFPLGVSVGPISVDMLFLKLLAKGSTIHVEASLSAEGTLGPISVSIDQVGFVAITEFQHGALDFGIKFKPPSGLGIAINATAVVGGGYLFFDTEKEQYAGILQLEIVKTIAIKAIGLLTTRMPDGSKGFSLLVIITAEGFGPIQLGFGFTLTGIGGLLGVNRTCVVDTLRSGIKNGTVGSILFPEDPVRNAQRIVSDVSSVFPPALHRYVFGPMVKINWGTPPILTMEIGLVLEVPDPIRLLILGRLLAVLPEEEAALVRIRMDSLGVIDFGKGEISLDATLYDSRILTFVLTGDMALRANFGANPGFLLSVGGWNPAFPSPPGFPLLSRMAITLSSSDNARLRLESYMAITSNTVQFGASVDLYFAVQPFSLEGYLGFDALFHFSPFSLQANLSASVTIRMNGAILMSVGLDATLTGPSPWHIWGSAHFSVLCFKQSVSFDVQYGSAPPPALPPAVDVKSLLKAALNDVRNWSSELPAGERPLVTFRATAANASVLSVHPLAELAVRERVVPLDMTISKYGSAPVSGDNTFSLKAVRSDGTEIPSVEKITDSFALAQFEDMSDDQKLSSPSFVQETAGIRFTTGEFAFGYEPALDSSITYTTLMIVPEQPAKTLPAYTMPAAVLDGAITSGAAAQASKKRPSGLGVRAA